MIESLDRQLSAKLDNENRIELLNMEVKNLNELMKQKDVTLKALQNHLNEKNLREQEIVSHIHKNEELIRENRRLSFEISDIKEKLIEFENHKSTVLNADEKNKYEDIIRKNSEQIEQLELTKKNLEITIDELHNTLNSLQTKCEENENIHNGLAEVIESYKIKIAEKDRTISDLREENKRLQNEINDLYSSSLTNQVQGSSHRDIVEPIEDPKDDELEEKIYILYKNFEAQKVDYITLKDILLSNLSNSEDLYDILTDRVLSLLKKPTDHVSRNDIFNFLNS